MQLRRATSADAAVLVALSADTFTETFGHTYRPDDLAEYLRETYTDAKYAAALDQQGCAAWIVEDGAGHALGYAFAGPASLPHPEVRAGDLELKRLYLRGPAQNGGWGSRLFEAAMAWIQAQSPAAVWIGVWSENHGARRFYARHGFEKVGEYLYEVGEARDLEFILRRQFGG